MMRGTTPTLTFTVPFDVSTAKKLWITFSQNNREIFTIDKEDCEIDGETITTVLSQTQTLALSGNCLVKIQMRASFSGSNNDRAVASDIVTVTVNELLKDGEI